MENERERARTPGAPETSVRERSGETANGRRGEGEAARGRAKISARSGLTLLIAHVRAGFEPFVERPIVDDCARSKATLFDD